MIIIKAVSFLNGAAFIIPITHSILIKILGYPERIF